MAQPVLSLVIRNTGFSSAERVRLTMDQDFLFNGKEGEKNIRGLPIFNGPVASIPPRAEIKLMLGVGYAIYARLQRCPPQFTVRAQYAFEGIEFDESSEIDIDAFKGHSIGKGPQAQALDKIACATEAIANHLNVSGR